MAIGARRISAAKGWHSGYTAGIGWHQLWRLDRSGVRIQNRCCPIGTHSAQTKSRETHMSKAKVMFPSDTIAFKDVDTGGNSAGNGGDGVNTGNISSNPSISFNPYNKAEGADVHVKTGDQVHQKADWDAGGANAEAEKHSKAEAGKAVSNGDQESDSGHNKSDVDASTTAYQENYLKADMSQTVMAGI